MRCVVIGAKGYVGSAMVSAARQVGWAVTPVDIDNYSQHVNDSCDVLINANGNAQRFKANHDPLFDFDASTRAVYRSLFDFKAERYALISTVDVYNDTTSPATTHEDMPIDLLSLSSYGFHKRLAELCTMRLARSWQVYRLAQMVGPGLRKGPIFDVLERRPLWVHPDTCLPYMDTRRVAATVVDLIQNAPGNDVYNVCGRGTVPFKDVLALFPPAYRDITWADTEKQIYHASTDKVHRFQPLPDSRDEIQAFIHEVTGTKAVDYAGERTQMTPVCDRADFY